MRERSCNDCTHCLVKGPYITCGFEIDEDDPELNDGIASDFAECCENYEPIKS